MGRRFMLVVLEYAKSRRTNILRRGSILGVKVKVTCGGVEIGMTGGDGDSALRETEIGGSGEGKIGIVIGMCNTLNAPEIEEKGS